MEDEVEVIQGKLSKIFIRGYGNLVLEIIKVDLIGVKAMSQRDGKSLYIPWSSIIMIED